MERHSSTRTRNLEPFFFSFLYFIFLKTQKPKTVGKAAIPCYTWNFIDL